MAKIIIIITLVIIIVLTAAFFVWYILQSENSDLDHPALPVVILTGHTVEYRTPGPDLKPQDFIANLEALGDAPIDIRFVYEPLPLDKYNVGEHKIFLALNDELFIVHMDVVDTTPPTADPIDVESPVGAAVSAGDFVTNVFDHSEIVGFEFVNEPDILAHQMQDIEVRITDYFGNSAVFKSKLTILLNDTPPVIEVTGRITARRGNPILFLQGVTAHDSFGRDLTDDILVESSSVDRDTVGEYEVIYSVTDATGLETSITVAVQIVNVDVDAVNREVDAVLVEIINDGMTQLEQVKAIHRWVRTNLSYASSTIEPENTYEGAYRALRDRRGNCFNYFSLSEVMLTRAGILNLRIDRIPGTSTRHRWNLVNPDELGWHHFDTTPVRSMNFGSQTAFFTDSEARSFTTRIQNELGTRNFYTYDPDLYPKISE